MRALSYLLSGFIGLVLVIFGGKAEVWAQTVSLDWRIFEVPEYGTRVDYPARIFGPAGERKRALVSASKALTVMLCSLFTPARMKLPIHL
jgi:hypothetical protein